MAESDADALRALLEDVETGSQELADMLTALAEDAGIIDENKQANQSTAEEINVDSFNMQCKCPRCGFEFDPPEA
jgi:hypothetical protein